MMASADVIAEAVCLSFPIMSTFLAGEHSVVCDIVFCNRFAGGFSLILFSAPNM